MNIDEALAGELQSAIVEVSDVLDSLADLGVVMIMLSSSSVSGRGEWIEKHLKSISSAAHDISLLITRVGSPDLLKPAAMLVKSASNFAISVTQAANESPTLERPESTRRQMVENWNKACVAISSLVLALDFGTAPWWHEIEERRPAYQSLMTQLLAHDEPS
jgi:hypothetical protein